MGALLSTLLFMKRQKSTNIDTGPEGRIVFSRWVVFRISDFFEKRTLLNDNIGYETNNILGLSEVIAA